MSAPTRRHAAIAAASAEPCPFCGSGGVALAKIRAPRARRLRVMEDRSGYPSLYRDHPRSLVDYTSAAAERIGEQGRATIASWAAHVAAGEYPVITDGRTNVEWRRAA